jgi:hypothetical protein
VPRPDLILWTALALAFAGSAIAWSDWVSSQNPTFLLLAVAMQAVPGAAIISSSTRDRRILIAVVVLAVPVLGPLAGLYVKSARGRGGADLLADLAPATRPRITGTELARRLTDSLPPCDALISGDANARRATLAHLSQRAGSEDIAILRWARNQRDAEVSVEAALALADLEEKFQKRLREARAAFASPATYVKHAALVRTICDGVVSGIVDAPLVTKLASEARRHHLEASVLDPERAYELVLPYGRLELAARRPDLALSLAERALSRGKDPEVVMLHMEAAYAARRFDLVPGLRSREADANAA